MKENDKIQEAVSAEEKNTHPELDYDALWKEAKYSAEHKTSER